MSKKNQGNSKVVAPPSDEKVNPPEVVAPPAPVESAPPQESDTNPIVSKIASLTIEQQEFIASFLKFKKIFAADKVINDEFKAWTISAGLYESSTNQSEVDRLASEIAKVKSALQSAGFPEDSPIILSAVKGLTAELGKAEKEVKDNLADLSKYFGVKLAKTSGAGRTYAATGDLTTYRPNLTELRTTDYLFNQSDKKAIVVHSSTIASDTLDTLGIKGDSQTWIAFEYNGLLDFTRNSDGKGKMIAQIKSMPENFVKAHPVVSTSEKLSGLIGTVAATLGLNYNGNGWQSNSELAPKFDKVQRVVKA